MVNLDYLYNPTAVKKIFNENYFVDKKLGFQVIEDGMILPHKKTKIKGQWSWGAGGCIVDSAGKFIPTTSAKTEVGKSYTPSQESIMHVNETVIYLGFFFHVWGHALTDNLRRLWFLKSDIFKSAFKNCSLVYVTWYKRPMERQANFRRLLEILGVDVESIQPITQPTRFEKIILPDESFYTDINAANLVASYTQNHPDNWTRRFTEEYRETIDRVRDFALKNRTPTSIKKIYYYYGKYQVGEERLAEYFKSKGYEIIRPEKLTLDEQLNLLINCESFASTLGSCSHNCLFLRDNAEVILIPRFNGFTGHQRAIDQVHSLNTYYVDSTFSIFNFQHDAFCYVISEQLKRFFGEKFYGYCDDDFKNFLQYTKFYTGSGRNINQNEVSDYGKFFKDFLAQLKQREDLIAACEMPPRWETFQPLLTYQTHIAKKGWRSWAVENAISNNIERKRQIEAIKINFPSHKVFYAVYFNDEEGWSEEVAAPEMAGTEGEDKPILGIKIRLDEAGAKEFDILYRVHKFNGKWTDWAKNGEELLSKGKKLNAVQIKLETKT